MKNTVYIKLGWVKPKILWDLKGVSFDTLKGKKAAGVFQEGLHWKKAADNQIWWNYEAIDEWVEHGYQQTG